MENIKDISLGQKVHDLAIAYLATINWEHEPTIEDLYRAYVDASNELFNCIKGS